MTGITKILYNGFNFQDQPTPFITKDENFIKYGENFGSVETFNLNVKSVEFNWYDVESISNLLKNTNYTNVVIYSYHSIEQIPNLNIDVFKNLLKLNIDIKFIHIEPVGFQYNNTKCPWNSASHYNRNLKSCLDTLQEKNLIELDNVVTGYFQSHTTASGRNATLIQWKKKHLL